MKNYRKAKVDANQKTIVDDLRKQGVRVEILGDPVDLFVWLPKYSWGFMEVKIIGSQAKYTRSQLLWMANTAFPVAIAHTTDEAMDFVRTGCGLSLPQKNALSAFTMRNSDKFYTPKEIYGVLNA
jgi:hypothetical protein